METMIVTSEHAQRHWRETIDAACADTHEIMKRELLILQGLKRAEKNRQERLEKPSSTVTLTELVAKLNLADQPETFRRKAY